MTEVTSVTTSVRPPRVGLYPYYVLVLLMLVTMINFIDRQLIAILSPSIQADLGLTDWQMGAVKGIFFALLYAFLGIPIARLADRTNRTAIVASAIAGWSVFTMLCGATQNFMQLAMARVGVSIGEAGGTAPAHSILSDYFPKEQRGFALSVVNIGVPLGIGFSFLGGGWLVTTFDWRTTCVIMGIPGLLVALLVAITVREPERGRLDLEPPTGRSPRKPSSDLSEILKTARHMLAIPTFRAFAIAGAIAAMASYAKSTWIVDFFTRAHADVPPMYVFTALGLTQAVANTAGIFLSGYLVDRLSKRTRAVYAWVPAICLGILFPLWGLCLWVDSFWVAIALQVPICFFGSTFLGPSFALAQTLSPVAVRSVTAALFLLIINLVGMGLGPTFVGFLSSGLMAQFGPDYSLRIALSALLAGYLVASVIYMRASEGIDADWARATGHQHNKADHQ
ncbi:spinster family MFS transporter [Hyphomonas johnsonii]|uniref:Major facilitator family transporter protein n=1 Tax=Hyphomonas johnsonii MHS-2 TaxID=1280950 RepID=A0A059FBH9_9PROT|nr:MFS transporter [Hyphomonas johnsonii]KCZ87916.1 major facilitator family transporter protein [Hyphomonas johnsonii MHS-2]